MTGARAGAAILALVLLTTGCQAGGDDADPAPSSSGPSEPTASSSAVEPTFDGPDDPALDVALSTPRQDPVYPQVGNAVVDALHYRLDLAWDDASSTLTGEETLVFRAALDSPTVVLDLSPKLVVSAARVDGEKVKATQRGSDLVLQFPVLQDDRHTLELSYSGTPAPVAAPTTRSDFSTNGWTITPDGETWTMQEPYGAHTWYAVNDQPADKALYDFTIDAPQPMIGVANGELVARSGEPGNVTRTSWHLSEPASSYLVTVAIGRFDTLEMTSRSGVPMSVWGPDGRRGLLRSVRRSALTGMTWIEDRLGPYPFDSLGVLLVDSFSGMETQTMITLGAPSGYTTSTPVIVHEMIHQWYGDQVTPTTWRDMWMNEGMTMFLQLAFQADHGEGSIDRQLAREMPAITRELATSGPAADYDPTAFGEGNVYYVPALMWNTLRKRLGEDTFWRLVRAWPAQHDDGNADYADVTRWWSRRTGQDLRPFFDSWLRSATLPSDAPVVPPRPRKKKQVAPGSSPGQV